MKQTALNWLITGRVGIRIKEIEQCLLDFTQLAEQTLNNFLA